MDDQLSRYRQSIDNIDAALVYMLAERFKVTKAVGASWGLPSTNDTQVCFGTPGTLPTTLVHVAPPSRVS